MQSLLLPHKNVIQRNYPMLLPLLFLLLCSFLKISAQDNLLITPKRVVFDGSKRSFALNLANIGNDTALYEISLIHTRMTDDGSFEKIEKDDSSHNFADNNLRFYPHNVVLAPNSSQSVRIQITKWDELNTGEYRSNLYFRAIPSVKSFEEKITHKDSGISIKMVPIFGISMPIIIQKGESSAKVSFSNASLQMEKDTMPIFKTTLNRTGNMSVYGDISVDYISIQGKIIRVGLMKGLAVYTPNAIRNLSFKLNNISGVNYHSGKLHVLFSEQSVKATKLAETEIALQ